MPNYATQDIRNFALVGHGDAGKTTLAEVILNKCGLTGRVGTVEEGNTVCDSDTQEKERRISIDSALIHANHNGKELNILDTPGYPEFIGQVIASLAVVESAIVTIAAPAGIQLNTRKVWDMAKAAGMARAIVVTKMDGENIDFPALVGMIQQTFGRECVPVMLPVGQGPDFSGVVDVLNLPEPMPDGVIGDPEDAHGSLVETVVEVDEEVMMRYLEDEAISPEELGALFGKAVAVGALVPILCCAARADKGVTELLDILTHALPSPLDVAPRRAFDPSAPAPEDAEPEPTIELKPDPAEPFCGEVFKSVTDPFVGKLSYFRVLSGSMKGDFSFVCTRTGKSQRVAQILRPFGREQKAVEDCIPGDILAFAKVEDVAVGDTLCNAKRPAKLPHIVMPTPMVALAVEPKSRGDEQKISSSLTKLAEEDPTFRFSRDAQTAELVVTGMSNLHLDIMLARLKERFQVGVNTKQPKIPYKETITAPSDAHYRHKKQTGGRGQFGEVYIRLKPLERGEGFVFDDQVVGGNIPNQFIPAVEKGVVEVMARGVLAGCPVVDVRLELYDGKHHPVDSSEAAFKMAGSKAFQDAFMKAKPVLLEPIVNMEVTVPGEFFGEISGHITGHRGRIQGMDSIGSMQVIQAEIPMAEIAQYATELKSMTGGQGSYSIEFSHYDIVPSNVAQTIIAKAKKTEEEE